MDEAKEILNLINTNSYLDDTDVKKIYDLDPILYDYDNHKRDEVMKQIIDKRDIKKDLAVILQCGEDEIAFTDEEMTPQKKYVYTGLHIYNLQTHEVINGKMHDLLRYTNYNSKDKGQKHVIDKMKHESLNGTAKLYSPIVKEFSDTEKLKSHIKVGLTCFCAGAALVSMIAIKDAFKPTPADDFINNYHKIVASATRRTDDNKGYYYLSSEIAKDILQSNDEPETVLYAVYDEVESDATNGFTKNQEQVNRNMNSIMTELSIYSDNFNFKTFEEYLKARGFTNEQGEVDLKMYNTVMRSYIDKMLMTKEYHFSDDNGGISR